MAALAVMALVIAVFCVAGLVDLLLEMRHQEYLAGLREDDLLYRTFGDGSEQV